MWTTDGPIVTRAQAKAQGLKRFFLGTPCKRGHVAERHAADRECCLTCKNEAANEPTIEPTWHAKQLARRAAVEEAETRAAGEIRRRRHARQITKEREQGLARNKAWNKANPERLQDRCKCLAQGASTGSRMPRADARRVWRGFTPTVRKPARNVRYDEPEIAQAAKDRGQVHWRRHQGASAMLRNAASATGVTSQAAQRQI